MRKEIDSETEAARKVDMIVGYRKGTQVAPDIRISAYPFSSCSMAACPSSSTVDILLNDDDGKTLQER